MARSASTAVPSRVTTHVDDRPQSTEPAHASREASAGALHHGSQERLLRRALGALRERDRQHRIVRFQRCLQRRLERHRVGQDGVGEGELARFRRAIAALAGRRAAIVSLAGARPVAGEVAMGASVLVGFRIRRRVRHHEPERNAERQGERARRHRPRGYHAAPTPGALLGTPPPLR